ncbi:hypothetical protein DJ564_27915 [Pseudomonas sp. 31-12]|nr:hypothetical protein DJ564_27915 [Pseudomonas sp. 31-12]
MRRVAKGFKPDTKTNVGAGLLAKAAGQSTSSLNDPPRSRASPLPQGIAIMRQINRGDDRGNS